MPSLPQYNSQRNIEARTSQPLRNEVAGEYAADQQVIGAIQGVTQKWSDAHDVMQFTEAKGKYEVGVADIQSRAAADPNYKDSDKYYKELEDMKKGSLQGVNNKMVMEKLSTEMDFGNQMAGIKIDNDFKQKELKVGKFNVGQGVEGLQVKMLGATNASEAMEYQNQITELLDLNVASGVLSLKEAEAIRDGAHKTAVQYDIYADPSTAEDQSQVLKELRDPKGKYSQLDAESRLDLIKDSQARIFQNNQTLKRENSASRDQKYDDIFAKMDEGNLTFFDFDRQMRIPESEGGIPKKQLITLKKAHQTATDKALIEVASNDKRAEKYVDGIRGLIANVDDKYKAREAIVEAFGDHVLTGKEMKFLNSLIAETQSIERVRGREKFNGNKMNFFKKAMNSVNDFFHGKITLSERDHAITIRNMISKMMEGKDAETSKNEALNELAVEKNPAISNLPKAGQPVMDAYGNIKKMFPDGSFEEFQLKGAVK